ncbi:MAG: hypothetical protein HUU41_00300 [Bryobacteraceae bacterium]|nr:hypothetical protein [Bryobacterales bacterium]MEB2363681.1 hypothetical protein [Bryobacterales bacterium]NUM99525.1 hypothetical protein [Bryobacteraceae bacterium]
MTPLEKVQHEIRRYEHTLLTSSVRGKKDGSVEPVIELKEPAPGMYTDYASIHPRDMENPQVPWTFQHYLYDCLRDYPVGLFVRMPQSCEAQP